MGYAVGDGEDRYYSKEEGQSQEGIEAKKKLTALLLAQTEQARRDGNNEIAQELRFAAGMQELTYKVLVKLEQQGAFANEQREVANETRQRQYQESARDKTRPSNYVGMSSPSDL